MQIKVTKIKHKVKKVGDFNIARGARPIVNKAGNAVGRYNPALKTAAKKRVSALLKAQK